MYEMPMDTHKPIFNLLAYMYACESYLNMRKVTKNMTDQHFKKKIEKIFGIPDIFYMLFLNFVSRGHKSQQTDRPK